MSSIFFSIIALSRGIFNGSPHIFDPWSPFCLASRRTNQNSPTAQKIVPKIINFISLILIKYPPKVSELLYPMWYFSNFTCSCCKYLQIKISTDKYYSARQHVVATVITAYLARQGVAQSKRPPTDQTAACCLSSPPPCTSHKVGGPIFLVLKNM